MFQASSLGRHPAGHPCTPPGLPLSTRSRQCFGHPPGQATPIPLKGRSREPRLRMQQAMFLLQT